MSKYIMAYDVGTTGIKTCIFEIDKDFKILASATESYKLYVYDDGGAEQDPDEWWAAMCSTTRVVLEKSGISPDKIAGVSFCSQAQGLVLVDKDGVAIRRAFSYMDQRARKEIKEGISYGLQIAGANIFKLIPALMITGAEESCRCLPRRPVVPSCRCLCVNLSDTVVPLLVRYVLLRLTQRHRQLLQHLFPVYQTTERPDRAAQAILEGRVVLLTDNSPEALIFPATLNSLFQTADDYYRNERIVTFLRLIRYVAAFLALALPGLYVAAATFHPQLLPGNLIRSMAEARSGVPFPTAAEVLLMELSFELLREAGLRMPGPAGNTIGIVGGLIVGQAAVSANLVSPITVTVAALTALGSFSIPNEELSEVFRLWKYGILLLGSCFGILGVMLGCFLLLMLMAEQESYGIPWLYPYVGGNLNERADEKDSMFLAAARKRKRRPIFAKWGNRIRFRRKS